MKKIFSNIPFDRINWTTSSFLIGTFLLTLTAVPAYIYFFGITWFNIAMFLVMCIFTGMSITLGYHRLFSHFAFRAKWPVKLFTLLFGAAAFENSVLMRGAGGHRAAFDVFHQFGLPHARQPPVLRPLQCSRQPAHGLLHLR